MLFVLVSLISMALAIFYFYYKKLYVLAETENTMLEWRYMARTQPLAAGFSYEKLFR